MTGGGAERIGIFYACAVLQFILWPRDARRV